MVVKELVALLGIKTDEKGQKKAEKGMDKIISLAKLAVAAFAAIKAVKWLSGIIQQVATLGDAIGKLSKKTGISTQNLQELEHAAKLSGGSMELLIPAFRRLQRVQVETARGSETYVKDLKALDIEIKNVDGTFKDTTELLLEIADGMQGLESDAERTAIAFQLLGDSGTTLIPMMKDGSAGLREMMTELRDLGGIMSKETIKASEDFLSNQQRLDVAIQGVKNSIAKDMLPQINKLTDGLIKWWKANGKIVRQRITHFFGQFGRVVAKNVKFFKDLLRTVIKFVGKLSPLEKGILAVAIAIGVLNAAIELGPIGTFLLLVAIFALLIEDWQTWKEGGKSAIGAVMKKWGEWLGYETPLDYDQWISDMELFADGVGSIFSGLTGGMIESLRAVGDFISDVWAGESEKAWLDLAFRMNLIWEEYLGKIQKGFDLLGIDFDVSLQGMQKAFREIWASIVEWFNVQVVQAIKNDILGMLNWIKESIPDWLKKPKSTPPKPGPKLEGAGVLAGGGGITGPGAATSISTSRVTSKTDIKIDIKAAPGMSEEKMGWEVGRQVSKAMDKENRTAMRVIAPGKP